MARMPGAIWTPKNVAGRSARRKGRCVVFHVAVSEAQNLMPGPDADWHFYVAKDGRIYQYIDTDLQCWATRDANPTAIAVETQGGVYDAQGEPWTAAQVASLAGIARWAHASEGIPLRLMQNSLPTERGLGWHRLGIDPWRVSGGELWSGARGKVCPGDAKIAQMPEVLRLALGQEDDMPTVNEFVDELLERTVTLKNGDTPRIKTVLAALVDRAKTEQADLDDIQNRLAAIEAKLNAPAEPPAS